MRHPDFVSHQELFGACQSVHNNFSRVPKCLGKTTGQNLFHVPGNLPFICNRYLHATAHDFFPAVSGFLNLLAGVYWDNMCQ